LQEILISLGQGLCFSTAFYIAKTCYKYFVLKNAFLNQEQLISNLKKQIEEYNELVETNKRLLQELNSAKIEKLFLENSVLVSDNFTDGLSIVSPRPLQFLLYT
jgi:hypothetical protein